MADYSVSTESAWKLVPVTKGTAFADGPCRGLLVGTAGTLNMTDGSGAARTNVPIQAGWNPVIVQAVAVGGTATDIWAVY